MVKDQYHHGDLRVALLDAAERALNQDPTRDVSIRGLANELEVSATAPHAHFKTKLDLLAALATRGFEKLRQETIDERKKGRSPKSKLEKLGEAYIRFSVDNPGLYKIMFSTGVTLEEHPELFTASRSAYAVLQDTIHEIFPDISIKERDRRALAGWGLVHGIAALLSEDRIPEDIIDDRSPRALARIVAETLLESLVR